VGDVQAFAKQCVFGYDTGWATYAGFDHVAGSDIERFRVIGWWRLLRLAKLYQQLSARLVAVAEFVAILLWLEFGQAGDLECGVGR